MVAELFYRDGIRATGVDAVAARAGVAPPTLYRLFPTKDDLVAAYVEQCSAAFVERLEAVASPAAGTARERLLAVFAVFADDALSKPCRGCPFLLVLAEFPDPASTAHIKAVAHKTWVRALLRRLVGELADESRVRDCAGLAEHLAVVAEGIYGAAQVSGADGPARHGRDCAESLINASALSA